MQQAWQQLPDPDASLQQSAWGWETVQPQPDKGLSACITLLGRECPWGVGGKGRWPRTHCTGQRVMDLHRLARGISSCREKGKGSK